MAHLYRLGLVRMHCRTNGLSDIILESQSHLKCREVNSKVDNVKSIILIITHRKKCNVM